MKAYTTIDAVIAKIEKDPLLRDALNAARDRLAKMKAEMTPEDFADYVCGHFVHVSLLPANALPCGDERSEESGE